MKHALIILALTSGVHAATFKLNEKELPLLVEQRNGRIGSEVNNIEASKAELGHLGRSFLPRLQLSLGKERTDGSPAVDVTNSYGYTSALASVNVFNGGRDQLRDDIRKTEVKKADATFQSARYNLITQARSLYWLMVYQKEIINIITEALKVNESNRESALKKIRSNLATRTDEIDFNQAKIQLEQDLAKARIVLANNMREMTALLNHETDTIYEVPDLNVHEATHTLDDFKKTFDAVRHRDIQFLEAARSGFELESDLQGRWWTPQLDVYGIKSLRFEDLSQTNEMDRDVGSVYGVKLTFFFDGLQSRATSIVQSLRKRGVFELQRQRQLELERGYANSYQLYVLNHDLIHSAEINNKMAQDYYSNIWSEYMRGIKNSPDVLQAFQRTVEAKLRYADIKKDYQVARAQILGYLQE